VDLLEKAIAAEPRDDFAPYTELVNILFARGDAARCISLLEQWLGYHPDDQKAKSSLELVRNSTTHP
jgi:hypothetical protein